MSSPLEKKSITELLSIFIDKIEKNRENINKWKNKGNPPGSSSRTRQLIRLSTHDRFEILFKIIEKQQEQINRLLAETY